ncbi:hypothetical protein, partial [Moraxella boevrei]|uniref:hypothetical protein n=1 Tax=Faucicola boevrei TaxID=346665 RepID=UPI00373574EB
LQLRVSASTLNSRIHHIKQLSVRKHGYGVALYPPPEVGGFTATEDKNQKIPTRGIFYFLSHFRHLL